MAHSEDGANESHGAARAADDPIDQVRELLFGAPKRDTIDRIRVLEDRIETMGADFLARIGALESRMNEFARDSEKRQATAYEALGGAVVQLGETIQKLSTRRKED